MSESEEMEASALLQEEAEGTEFSRSQNAKLFKVAERTELEKRRIDLDKLLRAEANHNNNDSDSDQVCDSDVKEKSNKKKKNKKKNKTKMVQDYEPLSKIETSEEDSDQDKDNMKSKKNKKSKNKSSGDKRKESNGQKVSKKKNHIKQEEDQEEDEKNTRKRKRRHSEDDNESQENDHDSSSDDSDKKQKPPNSNYRVVFIRHDEQRYKHKKDRTELYEVEINHKRRIVKIINKVDTGNLEQWFRMQVLSSPINKDKPAGRRNPCIGVLAAKWIRDTRKRKSKSEHAAANKTIKIESDASAPNASLEESQKEQSQNTPAQTEVKSTEAIKSKSEQKKGGPQTPFGTGVFEQLSQKYQKYLIEGILPEDIDDE